MEVSKLGEGINIGLALSFAFSVCFTCLVIMVSVFVPLTH